ncbi:hypothetical protein [Flagellimonas meridianipacifica]|uniref:Uncharacterized protein n=1 Tax=Flagellimonas meridianipacifica TaxID=1080225 RepID=A0A2T0MIU5_9FLAO|nr:hypothetical protein [Allomuricauda pacifica]PRX57426.1 hypothetical protein CLV81_1430 [Allomuricauda pacifica]
MKILGIDKVLTFPFLRCFVWMIGVSSILSCDPEESFEDNIYQRVFRNATDEEIKLVYRSFGTNGPDNGNTIIADTLVLPPNTKKKDFFEQRYSSDGVKEDDFQTVIETNISIYNTVAEVPRFELYIGNDFIREWSGVADYLGSEVNSPYNFDSWEIFKFKEIVNPSFGLFVYGEIVFTITDEDIGN